MINTNNRSKEKLSMNSIFKKIITLLNNWSRRKKSKKKKFFLKTLGNNLLIVTLISIVTSLSATYFITENNRNKSFCIKEIRDFNIKDFSYKDISILNKECKPYIEEYNLYEDILYSKDNTDKTIIKFSNIINELYAQEKIDKETILNFSDLFFIKIYTNQNFKFKTSIKKKDNKYNKRSIDFFINRYLLFKSSQDYKIKELIELKNYFNLSQYFSFFKTVFTDEYQYYVPSLKVPKYFNENEKNMYSERSINFFKITKSYNLYNILSKKIDHNSLLNFDKELLSENALIKLGIALKNKNNHNIINIISKPLNDLNNMINKKDTQLTTGEYLTYFHDYVYIFKLLMFKLSDYKIDNKEELIEGIINNTTLSKEELFNFRFTGFKGIQNTIYQFSYNSKLLESWYYEHIKNINLDEKNLKTFSFNENFKLLYKLFQHTNDKLYKKEIYTYLVNILKKSTLLKDTFAERDLNNIILEIFKTETNKDNLAEYAYLSTEIDYKLYPDTFEYFLNYIDNNLEFILKRLNIIYPRGFGEFKLFENILKTDNNYLSNKSQYLKMKISNKLKSTSEK